MPYYCICPHSDHITLYLLFSLCLCSISLCTYDVLVPLIPIVEGNWVLALWPLLLQFAPHHCPYCTVGPESRNHPHSLFDGRA